MKKTLLKTLTTAQDASVTTRRPARRWLTALAVTACALPLGLLLTPRAKSAGGPVAVEVANTPSVNVANPTLNVTQVDSTSRVPFVKNLTLSVTGGNVSAATSFRVPEGQRLELDYVSAQTSTLGTGVHPGDITLTTLTGGPSHYSYCYLPAVQEYPDLYNTNQVLSGVVADAGSTVSVNFQTEAYLNGDQECDVVLSLHGYLVPAS